MRGQKAHLEDVDLSQEAHYTLKHSSNDLRGNEKKASLSHGQQGSTYQWAL
jgi:hypothetical protein